MQTVHNIKVITQIVIKTVVGIKIKFTHVDVKRQYIYMSIIQLSKLKQMQLYTIYRLVIYIHK